MIRNFSGAFLVAETTSAGSQSEEQISLLHHNRTVSIQIGQQLQPHLLYSHKWSNMQVLF